MTTDTTTTTRYYVDPAGLVWKADEPPFGNGRWVNVLKEDVPPAVLADAYLRQAGRLRGKAAEFERAADGLLPATTPVFFCRDCGWTPEPNNPHQVQSSDPTGCWLHDGCPDQPEPGDIYWNVDLQAWRPTVDIDDLV
jgi:hypothetical protein